jgi:thiol-disulfide isomerase/thioredoxin
MSVFRPFPTSLAILALSACSVSAQDKPAAESPRGSESLEAVKKEFESASNAYLKEFHAAFDEARQNGKLEDFEFEKQRPRILFSQRFLSIAEKNPEGPEAIDALKMTLQTSSGIDHGGAIESRAKAVKILHDYYAVKPSIRVFLLLLAGFDDNDSKALVADVIARNPDRKIQMAAYREQISNCERLVRFAESVQDPKRIAAFYKRARGKEVLKQRLARAEKARNELDGLRKTLREKYGDLVNDLSIGNTAPEIKIPALDGTEARLSTLKGKVVVLDIWATWCPPCRAMIPHEREMVERLKDKPFALVSISVDEEKETLTDFLAKEKMPWTHWWNGSEGGIIDDWDVKYYPTIYVLDSQGVIRHKDLRGDELEKAVGALLAEQTRGKSERATK